MNKQIFLETPRLSIKKICPQDFEEFRQDQQDPEVMRFIGGPRDEATIQKFFAKAIQHEQQYGFSTGLIILKETQEIIGRGGLIYLDFNQPPDVEVVSILKKPYWNKGYTTELLQALLTYAFDILKSPRVYATIDPEHYASQRVAKKVGFQFIKEDYYTTLHKTVHYYRIERTSV